MPAVAAVDRPVSSLLAAVVVEAAAVSVVEAVGASVPVAVAVAVADAVASVVVTRAGLIASLFHGIVRLIDILGCLLANASRGTKDEIVLVATQTAQAVVELLAILAGTGCVVGGFVEACLRALGVECEVVVEGQCWREKKSEREPTRRHGDELTERM
ncbi:hypothetical protein HG530_013224 [Fusarium avenaceum]|nr:hypothetical protein HG530_013224 [Fusarium avenaceum]